MNQTEKPESANDNEPAEITLHLKLDAADQARVDIVIGWMRSDPIVGRLRANLGREKAFRYALAHCIAHPPAHVVDG